jgi:hypothetical protein
LAVGVLVEEVGRLAEGVVDGRDDAGDRGVHVGDGLDGFDDADRLARGQLLADGRQLDEDDVAELVLGEIGDADDAFVALDLDPLVFLGVTEFVRVHGCLLGVRNRYFLALL